MLHPEALWTLLLAAPIAFAFLYRGRSRPMTVPSLAIWREALGPEGKPPGHRRLREWLLLAANLLLLTLLAVGAAAPGQDGRGPAAEHWAFVVDVSASMRCEDGGPAAGPEKTRLAAARATVAELVARLPAGSGATLATAGALPLRFGPVPAAGEEFARALAALDWRPGPCRADAVWNDLARHPDAADFHVVFVSDGTGVAGLDEFLRDPKHHFVKLGGPTPNAAIVGATLERSWGDPAAELQLELLAAGPGPTERVWIVALGGREIARGRAVLPPGERCTVAVAVPTYEVGLLEARLEPADLQPLDDRAHLALAPLARPWVWLVTADRGASFLTPVLAALREHVDAERSGTVSPAEFRPERVPTEGAGVVIFDGVDPPATLPPGNHVFFGSGGTALPLRAGPPADAPALGRWASDHPLLRHAPLDYLTVARARRAVAGRDDRPLLESADGSLAVAGSTGGHPWVWFGFRLEDSNLPVLVAFPLLVKNLLAWFSGTQAWLFRPGYRCGEPVAFEPGQAAAESSARVRRAGAPAAEASVIPLAGGILALSAALEPGGYAVDLGDRRGAFGVSLFDPGETDVRAAARDARPPVLAERRNEAGEENPPWVRLALWALVVLGVEWVVFHAARSR